MNKEKPSPEAQLAIQWGKAREVFGSEGADAFMYQVYNWVQQEIIDYQQAVDVVHNALKQGDTDD